MRKTLNLIGSYFLLESAAVRRRSSMEEEEEGKIPRSIRHLTPLRLEKRDPSGDPCEGTEAGDDSGDFSSPGAGDMIFW